MPYFTPLCGIISTIVAAMAGLFVVIETGLVPVSGFGGFPGHGSFVLFPSFVPRRPAVIPAAMPINLQRGDAVFFTDASSGFLSADYIRDVTKKLSARTPRAVVDSSVMSSRAVIPAAMPVDLACGDAVVSSGPSSGFSAESGKTLSSVEDRSPASSALAPAAMPAAHNGVCSAFSSPFFSAANDGDMPHMSSVQTVSPVDDSSPASSALALVETPVNLASDDDDDEVFFSTANDLFPVESTDSAFVVAAFQPLPAPLAVNFTADPRKPTSSTTATPPPPINPTRYPGSLDYLWWYLLRTIFALMRLLAYWVYNYQSALTRHYVIPPTQPVAVIKKRAAGNSGGEQETEAEIVQVYGESIRQDWPWKSGVKFPKANSPAAPPSPSSPAVSPVASPAVSPATLPLGSSPAASPAASPSPSSPAVSPVAPSAVSSAESRAGSPAASPAALPLVSSPVVSPVASSAPSPAVLPLVSPPAVSPVASPTASPTPVSNGISSRVSSGLSSGFAPLPLSQLPASVSPRNADFFPAAASIPDNTKGCLAPGGDHGPLVPSASRTDNAKGCLVPGKDPRSLDATVSSSQSANGWLADNQDRNPAAQPHSCVGDSHHGTTDPAN
ncbi:MAG: hypothetical protein LQ350_000854 [Teloschistes chrysophthalmus]|nr:MAG: hypothetical protein LQ350_000854 [Niorma chrysophthalma]